MNAAIREIVGYIHPAWLQEAVSVEETAERYLPVGLRQRFINLVTGSVGDWLDSFDFESERLKLMYAMTDGYTGAFGSYRSKGTGFNFLAHNMCRLNPDGTWMIVQGGMGTISDLIRAESLKRGAWIETRAPVQEILHRNGLVCGVALSDGREYRAPVVVCGCDPFRIRQLVGTSNVPAAFTERLEQYSKFPGSSLKLNFAMDGLPSFSCLPEDRGQFRTTAHLLPDVPDRELIATSIRSFEQARRGEVPEHLFCEMMFQSVVDPSMRCRRRNGREPGWVHPIGVFAQWVPYRLPGENASASVIEQVLNLANRYAPGFSSQVMECDILMPQTIEERFGMTYGHIMMVDPYFSFNQRVPTRWPGLQGLYSASAACHPGGGVHCCAGVIAANAVLTDMGRRPYPTS